MVFLNVIMLSGLAGISVPVVLHLLSRARYRTVDWGAMMFLLGTDRRQRRNSRLRQWLLLAMRMLLVALVALALARPQLSKASWGAAGSGQVAAVLILDRSGSMAVRENDQARFDAAKTAAIQILSRLHRGDEATLLTVGDGSTEARPTTDLQGLARTIADLQPARGMADMAAALSRAADLLGRSDSSNRELYIICDRQRVSWSGIDAAWAAAWKNHLGRQSSRIYMVPVGGQETANVAIETLELTNAPLVADQTAELEIRVHNYASAPVSDIPLQLSEGERSIVQTTLALAPGASLVYRAQTRFQQTGPHVLTASITSEGFALDDTRELALMVGQAIPMLIISGDERSGIFRGESDFLRVALAPWEASGKKGPDPVKVQVVGAEHWPRLDVTKNPVVILANVAQLSESQARDLEQFVYSGGGLIVTVGNLVQAQSYNNLLYRDGAGILPAELADATAADAAGATTILGVDLNHPMLRFLRNRPDPVPVAAITRHIPVKEAKPDSRTLITLASGQPLLLEAPAGRGRVLLLTSSIDADWNSLPLTGFYLPFVQSAVKYMASGNAPDLNIACGEPITLSVIDPGAPAAPAITLPDGRTDHMEMLTTPVATELRYLWTALPGRYTVLAAGGKPDWIFLAQPPAAESDLAPLSEKRLAELRDQVGMDILDTAQTDFAATVGQQRQGRELWLPVLLAAIVLGIAEMALTRSWAHARPTPHTEG